jgi:hypothetical protein
MGVLQEAKAGAKIKELCRRCGISEATFCINCKAKYAGMTVSEAGPLKELERLADLPGLPLSTTADHGPESDGQVLDAWAYPRNLQLSFVRPGKPSKNAITSSPSTGKFSDECMNERWLGVRSCSKERANAPRRIYPFDPLGCRTMNSATSWPSCASTSARN